jgi:predicted permease
MNGLLQDAGYALRQLRKNSGFTAVAVLTLALGIGANTAIFTMVQGVVLAPLPFKEPDRLVTVWQNNLTLKHIIYVSYPDFLDWQRSAHAFEQMVAFASQSFDLTNPGAAEHVNGKEISSGFFGTLGAKLVLGRDFLPEEDRQGGAPSVIISDRLWNERFARSSGVLGKSLALSAADYTVVGVVASGFHLVEKDADDADVYTPLGQEDLLIYGDRTIHPIFCIGRLKPGVSMAQAQSEIRAIQQGLNQLYPVADKGLGADILPLKQVIVGDTRGTLFLLFGAVGIVLLIACANVANLLLTRAAARTREFAIRSALGADRMRIARQIITESVLLSLAGGALGLAVAKWGLAAALASLSSSLPRSENIAVNLPVLLFTSGISIVVEILFGLAPALKGSKTDLQTAMQAEGRGVTRGRGRTQSGLVIAQMALSLVLLAGAGLLLRTIRSLWQANPGFDAQHLITFKGGA